MDFDPQGMPADGGRVAWRPGLANGILPTAESGAHPVLRIARQNIVPPCELKSRGGYLVLHIVEIARVTIFIGKGFTLSGRLRIYETDFWKVVLTGGRGQLQRVGQRTNHCFI